MFAPFILTLLLAGMLIVAAITFTSCVAVPCLRRFSITAPAASLVLSPILFSLGYQTWITVHHVFIPRNNGPIPTSIFWILELLATVFFIGLALTFALICRAVLEYGPPFLTRSFGLKPPLFLQSVLLVGALASALVDLTLFATLAHESVGDMPRVLAFSVTGLITTAICIRPIFHLENPRATAPNRSQPG